MSFESFDPLKYKTTANTDVAANALKRELQEILGSYVGWYDPFSELIQNALDSVENRKEKGDNFDPTINIVININNQSLTVSDNGTGLTKKQFNQFLVPFFSFKSGNTRGHKGVGATYLAYGFNFMQICTKNDHYEAYGKMINAREWLFDDNPSGNPEVIPENGDPIDSHFQSFDSGVSITLKFDQSTHPKDLSWIGTENPESWLNILRVKTGLGAFKINNDIKVRLTVVDSNGESRLIEKKGIEYLWLREFPTVRRTINIRNLENKLAEFFKKRGYSAKLPSSLKNYDLIEEIWESKELEDIVSLDKNEIEIIRRFTPKIYCGFGYSAKIFNEFNESLGVRTNYKVLTGGFQISANNMPQGEIYQIPLQRYIGRQNQIHFLINFDNCSADLGRKGFHKEIVDFCKSITEKIVTNYLNKFKPNLRPITGAPNDLQRAKKVADWKEAMKDYEKENPLKLINENFFQPTKKISITSLPTREQDVISLFNQLIAGGVIRGINIMSTNERFTYDGLYHIKIEEPSEDHIFDIEKNPLGILSDVIDYDELPFISHPEILEYKYSLDGLIEDINDETKNSNDITLVVAWETGELYKENYHITSLLDSDNLSLRQYHGVTHIMTNYTTDQKEMDLIVLSELIEYLNDSEKAQINQKNKYDEF